MADPNTSHRDDAFHVLRICAAAAVIFSHHFHITGTKPPTWLHADMVGGVAVMTFFTISGYLVSQSWARDPRWIAFAGRRLLRLWPGVAVAVFADVLIFGPVFTSLPLWDFWSHPATFEHLWNLNLVDTYVNLPGVFAANPLAGLMNGPLWTIPMELMCYAALALAGILGLLRHRALATLVMLSYIGFFLVMRNADTTGTMYHWFEYPAYFACGALIALYRQWFLAHGRLVVLLALPIFAWLFFKARLEHTAGLLLLPPLIIFLGTRHLPWLSGFYRAGDPSYGIYLLGCPVQQAVQAVWPELHFFPSLILALSFSAFAGYASWHWVEKPALSLKRYLAAPGRPSVSANA